MRFVFDTYEPSQAIDVTQYLKNRKLSKYFNKETAAAIVGVGKLLDGAPVDLGTPFFYATGLLEYEDYGLNDIVANSVDAGNKYSQELFVAKGITNVSPLNQFKILQNMPLCFVSLAYGFQGDNAVIYASAGGLINCALYAATDGPVIIGAGKVTEDGRAASGFAVVQKSDLAASPYLNSPAEAIEIFQAWAKGGRSG
ncbi:MAG: hypothetical protein LBR56_08140 [Sporomusaceae bacterium]|jgi:hypothetical protein|nr:hypothetical protein [Sporomusaceae bacterium]